jgi:diguanylate cyclase (GGDEF)-like protein/PAS domain S-box-containing protein
MMVLMSAWFAHSLTRDAGKQAFENTSSRQQLDIQLNLISEGVTRSESALLNYMIEPSSEGRKAVVDALNLAISGVSGLANAEPMQKHTKLHNHFKQLARDLPTLLTQAKHLMTIRADTEQLYPASPLLMGQMLITHTEFSANSSLALQDARLNRSKHGQADIAEALNDIRYAWTNRIGAFRLYVANRSGLFGEPGKSMAGQRTNIKMFGETVDRSLVKLKKLSKRGLLRFEQEDAFERMVKAKQDWDKVYLEAVKIYESDNWRMDIPLLKHRIQPLFSSVHASVAAIKSELSLQADSDLMGMGNTSAMVTNYIWLLGICAALFVIPAYLAFRQIIQQPLEKIVNAIEAEARGDDHYELPDAQVDETRALVNAFAEMREAVHSRQQRLSAILDHAAEGIITFDEKGRIESFNNAAESLFGYRENEIIGKDLNLLIPAEGRDKRVGYLEQIMHYQINRLSGHENEVVGQHKNGSHFPMALKISSMEIEGKKLFTGMVADISERKAMVEHLKQIAEHDGLTGLFNRTYFQEELERVIERERREQHGRYAVLYLDLDNFKFVNDTMGHAAGDDLLIEVADLLTSRVRSGDLMARFGGDEFTVLLFNVAADTAVEIANSFRQLMSDYRFLYEGKEVDVGCSIGVAAINADMETADEALSRADFACNMAKRNGRNRVHLFIDNDQENMNNLSLDMGWSRRIKQAIEHDHFVLVEQPIISTSTRETEYSEILLRLLDENGEIIMPAGFLPAAERFGLAEEIDRWVIVNAIETLAEKRKKMSGLRYSINLSGQTLTNLAVCDLIHKKINETGLDPDALMFEVTETVAIADMSAAADFLSRLHLIGCKTALDDFGSGMSSFAYLKDLPVDVVKIDGRFVKNIAENHVDQAMVKAMNEIAHALDKLTVAEFVEDEATMKLLTEYNVDYAQGFHLGKPEMISLTEKKRAIS